MKQVGDISVELNDYVAVVEIRRPPYNYFDKELIGDLASVFEELDADKNCRASVLAAEGKAFCAGAVFQTPIDVDKRVADAKVLYAEAVRLFRLKKPIIGAVDGAAIGGGLGLALVPDFRVTCPEARFAANFTKIGIHPGFGLTLTLPHLIGQQKASLMFFTGMRIKGDQAFEWGLADQLTERVDVRNKAVELATEIANSAPLAIQSTRKALRADLVRQISGRTDHELAEQKILFATQDFVEGVASVRDRRVGLFNEE